MYYITCVKQCKESRRQNTLVESHLLSSQYNNMVRLQTSLRLIVHSIIWRHFAKFMGYHKVEFLDDCEWWTEQAVAYLKT
jgi:hypothetical protein